MINIDYYKIDPQTKRFIDNSPEAVEYRADRKAKIQAHKFVDGRPLESKQRVWEKLGKNADNELAFYDSSLRKRGDGKYEKHYTMHKPTWEDRAKEFGQGVAGGIGTMADLASNYVASPIISLISKPLRVQADIDKKILPEGTRNVFDEAATSLENLSDQYWNQNAHKSFKEADFLKTKNKDTTASILRGTGEFLPDLIPANMIGKGAKILSTAVHGSKPIASTLTKKKSKGIVNKTKDFIAEPKLPKLSRALETPITASNAASFAGAGAAHGALTTTQDIPWYIDLPAMMLGGAAGAGAVNIGKSKKRSLTASQRRLINKINKGDITLDTEFIEAAKKANIPLNAFNIYKNNKEPYKISRWNQNADAKEILPDMKRAIYDNTVETLDNALVKHDKNDPRSELEYVSNLLKERLRNSYQDVSAKGAAKYAQAERNLDASEKIIPRNFIKEAGKLNKDTETIAHGGSSLGVVNELTSKILRGIPKNGEVDLGTLVAQKRAINDLQKTKTLGTFDLEKTERNRLKLLGQAIDNDIHENIFNSKKSKNKEWYRNFKGASEYHANSVVPFREDPLFEKLNTDKQDKETLLKILNDPTSHDSLENLINITGIEQSNRLNDGVLKSKPYQDLKLDTKWIKRLLAEDRLFGAKDRDNYSLPKLLTGIKSINVNSPLYQSKQGLFGEIAQGRGAAKHLRENIRPIINKYEKMAIDDKRYRGGLTTPLVDTSAPILDIKKHLTYVPNVVGAAAGSALGDISGLTGHATGALVGALAGGAVKNIKSAKTMRTLTDKKFVDELIRIGKLPKERRSFMIEQIRKNPVLRTEILKELNYELRENE